MCGNGQEKERRWLDVVCCSVCVCMHTVCRYDVWVQWPCDPMNIVMVLGSIDSQWQCEHGTYLTSYTTCM